MFRDGRKVKGQDRKLMVKILDPGRGWKYRVYGGDTPLPSMGVINQLGFLKSNAPFSIRGKESIKEACKLQNSNATMKTSHVIITRSRVSCLLLASPGVTLLFGLLPYYTLNEYISLPTFGLQSPYIHLLFIYPRHIHGLGIVDYRAM